MDWGAWWTTVHGVTKEMDTTWHLNNNNALGWLLLLFSCSVMSNCLWPHGLQHHPSPSPGAYWNSCPLSRWCHPTISSFVVPFSSCLQSFPASRSFLMSQFYASGGQRIGVSTSASVFPVIIQDWFPLGWHHLRAEKRSTRHLFGVNISPSLKTSEEGRECGEEVNMTEKEIHKDKGCVFM